LFDLNSETYGLNRNEGESTWAYIKRLCSQKVITETTDNPMSEFMISNNSKANAKLITCPETYYFNFTAGESKRFRHKRREMMSEPDKISKMAVGFELDVI
jgi:hypothetical protein